MSASTDRIKRYVGVGADALAYAMRQVRETQDQVEANPPVGAKSEYKPTVAAAVGGISTGTLMLIAIAWYLFKR